MKKQFVMRQGDVDIFKVQSFPKKLKLQKSNTLAYGEVTGHHHTMYTLDGAEVKTYLDEISKKTYFEVIKGHVELKHQEHKTQVLTPGKYVIEIERDYDYFTESIQQVRD